MKILPFTNDQCIIDAYSSLNDIIDSLKNHKYYYLIDQNIYQLYPEFIHQLPNLVGFFIIDAKEENKTLTTYQSIIEDMLKHHITKNIYLCNIGGGIVCDTGGFVAGTYKRGLDFINIPTTLISQIDASIGGKNGLNMPPYKNVIGTIKQPKRIILCNVFLNTLDNLNLSSGQVEMLKLGLVQDVKLLELYKNYQDLKVLELFAYQKGLICVKDEWCLDLRNILNFGHTMGHAFELIGNIPHGISVGMGMYFISEGKIKEFIKDELIKIGINFDYYYQLIKNINPQHILDIIKQDKKNNDFINIIKVSTPGSAFMQTISLSKILEMLKDE